MKKTKKREEETNTQNKSWWKQNEGGIQRILKEESGAFRKTSEVICETLGGIWKAPMVHLNTFGRI